MKNVVLLLFIVLFAGFSCKPKQVVKYETVTIVTGTTRSEEELARLIFENGDLGAYHELRGGYYFGSYKLLVYALYMANKYDYALAHCDVYYSLARIHDDLNDDGIYNLDGLDETTRQMSLDYLRKASKGGDTEASWVLGKYYMDGKYFKKDTVLGKELINKLFGKPRNTENAAH